MKTKAPSFTEIIRRSCPDIGPPIAEITTGPYFIGWSCTHEIRADGSSESMQTDGVNWEKTVTTRKGRIKKTSGTYSPKI